MIISSKAFLWVLSCFSRGASPSVFGGGGLYPATDSINSEVRYLFSNSPLGSIKDNLTLTSPPNATLCSKEIKLGLL